MSEILINKSHWDRYNSDGITVYLNGCLRIKKDNIISSEQLLSVVKPHLTSKKSGNFLPDLMNDISGNYAFIIKNAEFVFAAVDICRSKPLFYSGKSNKDLQLFDGITFNTINESEKNEDSLLEFYEIGIVTGKKTVINNTYQLQAGEYLFAESETFRIDSYFQYKPTANHIENDDVNLLVHRFDSLLTASFERLVDLYPSSSLWVVPLSGGHDSRLIINYLHKTGYKNVVCYTYGAIGNSQSEISKRVAEAAGYSWHFIEYTEDKWDHLHQIGAIDDYFNYSFNGVSTPHIQDLLAVFELKQQGIISDQSVFLPGHTSVSEHGFQNKYTSEDFETVIKLMAQNIYKKKFFVNKEKEIRQQLYFLMDNPAYVNACYKYMELQAKNTNNSLRVYEYFGYDYAIPLLYKDICDFWINLPLKYLVDRKMLYIAEEEVLDPIFHDIPFTNSIIKKGPSFKKTIKKIVPQSLINFLLSKTKIKSVREEALNLAFAQKGNTIRDIMEPLDSFPEIVKDDMEGILERKPYQISVGNMSKLYTIKKLFE